MVSVGMFRPSASIMLSSICICDNACCSAWVICSLSRRAQASQRRRTDGRRVAATFDGGPLHGMTIAVTQYEAAGQFLGFGVITDDRPGQVLYWLAKGPGVWCSICGER